MGRSRANRSQGSSKLAPNRHRYDPTLALIKAEHRFVLDVPVCEGVADLDIPICKWVVVLVVSGRKGIGLGWRDEPIQREK